MLETIVAAGRSVFGSVGVVQSLKDVVRGRQSESWADCIRCLADDSVKTSRGRTRRRAGVVALLRLVGDYTRRRITRIATETSATASAV